MPSRKYHTQTPVLVRSDDKPRRSVAAFPCGGCDGVVRLQHLGDVGRIVYKWNCGPNEKISATDYEGSLNPGDVDFIDAGEGEVLVLLILDGDYEGADEPTEPNLAVFAGDEA